MKRVVSSSIISVIVLLLIAGAFFYFQIKKNFSASVFKLIPSDVAWVVSVSPASGDLQRLARTSFFNGSDSVPALKEWKSALLSFDSLCVNDQEFLHAFNKSALIMSAHVTGPSTFELVFFCKPETGLPENPEGLLGKVFRRKGETQIRNYNGTEIHEFPTLSGNVFSWSMIGGVFVGSTASFLVEDAIRQQMHATTASPALALEENWKVDESGVFVAYRYSGFSKWLKTHMHTAANVSMEELERVAEWTFLRLDLHANMIGFRGATFSSDSTSFIGNFDNQQPVDRKLLDWLPAKTAAAIIWGMSDPDVFFKSVKQMNDLRKPAAISQNATFFNGWMGNEIALIVTQPAVSVSDNNFLALISVKDSMKCMQSLSKLAGPSTEAVELYNGYTIRFVDKKSVMEEVFGPLFKKVNRFYYTAINHHIVIGNQASVLRAYINDIKTGNILTKEERYRALAIQVPKKGNLFFYASIPQSVKLFKSIASPVWTKWLEEEGELLSNWNGLTLSVSNVNGVYETVGGIGYFSKTDAGPQLMWNAKLDTTIAAGPFYAGGAKGLILVSDVNDQLYAFDASGDLKWKKKLETAVLSTITSVDYYNNGSHQYLFNTHSFIYLLDSAGNNAGNYPFRLPAEASAGLTYVEMDRVENNGIYIPCKNLRLYAYALTGKPMSGYTPMKLPGVIIHPVFYNKAQQKLVLLEESGLCFVADISGQRLFTVKGAVKLRENSRFFSVPGNSGLISFISSEGKLNEIDGRGEIMQTGGLSSTMDTVFSVASADLNGDLEGDWIISGNEGLRAFTGDGVSLFRFNNGDTINKVSAIQAGAILRILALSENKIFLFNRDGTLAEGFPLPGMDLPEITSSHNKEDYFLLKERLDGIALYLVPRN